MGDDLRKLPINKNENDDITTINTLKKYFGEEKINNISSICSSNMEIIAAAAVFFIVNLPYVETLIKKVYSNAENPYILILCKTIIFTILYFLVNNFYLLKK
jgi:hypothetical protein